MPEISTESEIFEISTESETEEVMITAKQFSTSTNLPISSIRRYCRTGIIPSIRVGRVYYFDEWEAKEAIDRMKKRKSEMAEWPNDVEASYRMVEEMIKNAKNAAIRG